MVLMNEDMNPNTEIANLTTIAQALNDGKGIIDGGATSSVGSTEAIERVRHLQWQQTGKDVIEILPDERPSFKFGDNGKLTCVSTAQIEVPVNGNPGQLQVHLHDRAGQPVLISVKSLRKLGAIIDFDADTMILKHVAPNKVIPLERAASGHQLFPLVEDIFQHARTRATPLKSLDEPTSGSTNSADV